MLKNLDSPPNRKNTDYLQADYIELLCLVNEERIISTGDIQTRYTSDCDFDSVSREDWRENLEIELDEAEMSDKLSNRIEELLRHLSFRQLAFGELYPFSVSDDLSRIQLRSGLDEHHRLYVYLLMASCLRHYDKSNQTQIAYSFENISAEALKEYVGDHADVHIFSNRSAGRYAGQFREKIKKLSIDLHERLANADELLSTTHSGDGGLDIVGWFETNDNTPGKLLVFGQCACTEKWDEKLHSSGYKKWKSFIDLSIEPVNAIFIPYFFRDSGGKWYEKHRIQMSLLVDRLRIMKLLQTVENPLRVLPSEIRHLIDRTLSFVEQY